MPMVAICRVEDWLLHSDWFKRVPGRNGEGELDRIDHGILKNLYVHLERYLYINKTTVYPTTSFKVARSMLLCRVHTTCRGQPANSLALRLVFHIQKHRNRAAF